MSCCGEGRNGTAVGEPVVATLNDQTTTVGAVASQRQWVDLPVGGWVQFRTRIWGTQSDVDNGFFRAQEGLGGRTAAAGVFIQTPIAVGPGGYTGALAGAPVPGVPAGWAGDAVNPVSGTGLLWDVIGAAGQTVFWSILIEVVRFGGGAVLT